MAYKNQLFLRDRDGRPWGKVDAHIKWTDGRSTVWVPESGDAEFNGSGEIETITVAGEEYGVYRRVNNDGQIVIKRR